MNTILTISIVILIADNFIFYYMWKVEKNNAKFFHERWNYFESEYYKVYAKWVKKLSKEELLRVQNAMRDKGKQSYELDEPLTSPYETET